MNERIKIVSDTEVHVGTGFCPNAPMRLWIQNGSELVSEQQAPYVEYWDNAGRDALIDVLQCHRATGSFAALADTSAVPFVGKKLRHGGDCIIEVARVYKDGGLVGIFDDGSHATINRNDFGPLVPPATKVRPYTPVEAAVHLGRLIRGRNGLDDGRVCSAAIEGTSIKWSRINGKIRDSTTVLFYAPLASDYTWADDGTPCGTIES